MKYTLMYFKWIIFILLLMIFLAGVIFGVILGVVGVFGALIDSNAMYLVMVPTGLLCGLMSAVAKDAIDYISDKWSWKI